MRGLDSLQGMPSPTELLRRFGNLGHELGELPKKREILLAQLGGVPQPPEAY